jgi:hypothetical protein
MRAAVGVIVLLLGGVAAFGAPAPKAPVKPAPAKAPAKLSGPMAFKPAELDLAPGETYPVELFVPSPTGKTFNGTPRFEADEAVSVTADPRWTGRVPAWGVKTYPKLTAARTADGEYTVRSAIGEKGPAASLKVRVAAPRLEIVTGLFKMTIKVTNPFKDRVMNGRIALANPDRFLEDVTTAEFKINPGATQDLVIPLPGAAPVEGETYDFTLTIETYQGYKHKQTYPLEFPSHT